MKLRRIVTVYTLAFGVPLLLLGGGTSPAAVRTEGIPRVQTLQAVALPAKIADPVTVTLATPTRRVVKRVQVGHYDIPATALLAYQRAAKILTAVKPSCHLSWPLLAAIGRVESDHGRFGGATLAPTGFSSPRVVGVALDGNGPVAAIPDTDHGQWDGDTTWDHAVGPMQFLPSTWRLVGVDADGDGMRSIDDINDAALGAGVYLCAGTSQSLASSTGMQQAVYRYNPSDHYVALVMAYEALYSGGDFQVVTPDQGVGASTAVLTGPSLAGVPLAGSGAVKAKVKTAVREAIASTQRHHGTTIQRSAGARKPADKTTTVKVTPANATDKSTGKSADKGSGGGSSTPTPSPTPTGSSTGGSGGGTGGSGGGTGGSGSSGGSGGSGTDSGGTSPPADQGGSGGGTTTDQSGGDPTPSPTPDSQDSTTQTPTPEPDPTPTPNTVTGVVTEQGGSYYLDGKPLELGTLADSAATARGDFDGDGAVETNGAELAGLVGKTVTMVVVERTSGSLGIYSINGISLA